MKKHALTYIEAVFFLAQQDQGVVEVDGWHKKWGTDGTPMSIHSTSWPYIILYIRC